jgi:hypothetical protein
MPEDPKAFMIGHDGLLPCPELQRDVLDDPRGLLLMWEPPQRKARYVMGLDSAEGITGWSRGSRGENDKKKDNSAIEIYRIKGSQELVWKEDIEGNRVPEIDLKTGKQRIRFRDVQVAEFAAPVDPVAAAQICNILGRIYQGDAEEQCECIWESWPGCGMLATQEFLRLGYSNPWYWEFFADAPAEQTGSLGWHSTLKSQQILWMRSRRHYIDRGALIRSKWLKGELGTARSDWQTQRAMASSSSFKDDRMQASNMALWVGNKWVYDVERTWEQMSDEAPKPPSDSYFQNHVPVLGEETSYRDWREAACADWMD